MDDEYIDKVLSGDTHAFRYFLDTYKDMAFNVSVSVIKDDHFAEEVVQDAFVKAFNALRSFNRASTFKTWFYRIVVNESFKRLKKLDRERNVIALSNTKDVKPELQSNSGDTRTEQVVAALKILHPNEGLALNLFYLEGYSLAELVKITGWTMANTKVILHRARKNLRAQLEKKSKS